MDQELIDRLKTRPYISEVGNEGTCRGCGAPVIWCTTVRGKHIPMDIDGINTHWSVCPKSNDFRKPGPRG